MGIVALAGGVGSARFLSGLARVVDPATLTIVVNTGDDERMRGLHVSPDIDTVLYHLSGLADWQRGWGLLDETFVAQERYAALAGSADDAMQAWFALGDRDIATHMFRTRLLETGHTLSDATSALRRAMGVASRILPMSDDPVRTVLVTPSGERIAFQDYFVLLHHDVDVASVSFDGADTSMPSPGVLDAIAAARTIVVPPSNPLISVAPVLAVPGIRDALASAGGVRVGVSPIVGGRAVKGPADRLMETLHHEVSALGVARLYRGLVDVFVLDEQDARLAAAIEALGMRPVVTDTIMRSPEDAARLAKAALA